MKTLGILGGLGPESTIEYYRLLIETRRSVGYRYVLDGGTLAVAGD